MEEMEQGELMLLDLPTLVIEEILLNLNLRDRKIIRLTCKRLYELCNSTRICMTEKIIWRKIDTSIVNVQPGLLTIGRSCYNLVIDGHTDVRSLQSPLLALSNLQKLTILQFFKVNGAKVRSLVIEWIYFAEGFLEPLIISCENLRSLTLSLRTREGSSPLDYFTLEPNTITRPTVTYLQLVLPEHQPSKYFRRMLSVFPSVKQLKIVLYQYYQLGCYNSIEELSSETAQECSAIFDDIMECGSNLESLHLNIPLRQFIAKGSQFSKALSNLKDLSIKFNHDAATLGEAEKLYSCFSNLASLELLGLENCELVRVLENTQLNYLNISSCLFLVLNEESFKALVSSKLKILRLEVLWIKMPMIHFPLEANTTVTDLYLSYARPTHQLLSISMYFCGVVHLSINNVTDALLQHIFQYQQNLRSLVLANCKECSVEGFCGSKDGRLKYSINNLQSD